VQTAQDTPPPEAEHPGKVDRAKLWAAAMQARAQKLEKRAQDERTHHASVDAAFEMADRDGETAGGIIAGALAYRLFIWLLPAALVAVAGLGIAADAAGNSPDQAAKSVGLVGLVSSSVASAAKSSNRWYALIVGIPILIYVTRSVLRALIGVHRLVWTDDRAAAPKPKLRPTLELLALMVGIVLMAGLTSAARHHIQGVFGVLLTVLMAFPLAGLWLYLSYRMPHRDATWRWLIPGAAFFAVGAEILHLIAVYAIAPYANAKQGTYGALGAAAALLFGLYIFSRVIVFAAVINATLWARHGRAG
jgi:uncharacterized BrkB/YihY/UPF0761 family membrane protein